MNKNDDLGEKEAFELFHAIRTGVDKDGGKVSVGQRFRDSYWNHEIEVKSPAWQASIKYYLPVDDVISRLVARDNEPCISRHKLNNSSPLKIFGPYVLVRSHLYEFASFLPDPDLEREKADQESTYLEDIVAAAKALSLVTNRPWWDIGSRQSHRERSSWYASLEDWKSPPSKHTPIANEVIAIQTALDDTYANLARLYKIVEDELSLAKMQPSATGRPRLLWKEHFVWCVAHVWRLLTGAQPSRSEESLFGEFVYSCWNSFDDEMPEVSFARAIRNLDLTKPPVNLR